MQYSIYILVISEAPSNMDHLTSITENGSYFGGCIILRNIFRGQALLRANLFFTYSVSYSIPQSVTRSLSQSLNPSVSHSLPQSVTHSLSQSLTPSVSHPHPKSVTWVSTYIWTNKLCTDKLLWTACPLFLSPWGAEWAAAYSMDHGDYIRW